MVSFRAQSLKAALFISALLSACTLHPVAKLAVRNAAAPILAPDAIAQVSLSHERGCAVMGDETVRCWSGKSSPAKVAGVEHARSVALGAKHACAVLQGGKVLCWGANSFGQLGNGILLDSETPVEVSLGFGVVADQIAAGAEHTCVTTNSGPWVKCWGRNDHGQLGNGERSKPVPEPVSLVPGAMPEEKAPIAIAAGENHTCVITGSSSDVWCWGAGGFYQLGNDRPSDATSPVQAPGATGMVSLAAAGNSSCGIRSNGRIACWGDASQGAFGPKKTEGVKIPADAMISGMDTASELSITAKNGCAVRTNGTLACWGDSSSGIIERKGSSPQGAVTELRGLEGVTHISLSEGRACAILKEGALRCWGG